MQDVGRDVRPEFAEDVGKGIPSDGPRIFDDGPFRSLDLWLPAYVLNLSRHKQQDHFR